MPEAVSLGTVYSTAELRLDGYNKSWDSAVAKLKVLQEKLDGLKFDPAKIVSGTNVVSKGFTALKDSITTANDVLGKLNKGEFKATGILQGADQATRALGELAEKAGFTSQRVLDLSAKSAEAKDALRGLGTMADGAEKKLGTLAAASTASAASVADVGKAGTDAGAGLTEFANGAGAAKTSVSGLGRAAGLTAGKLDTLSLAKFDPAGIVAGADEGIGALERLRLAAQGVRSSLRMSPVLSAGTGTSSGRRMRSVAAPLGRMAGDGVANAAAGATVIAGLDLKNYVEYSGQNQQIAGNTNMSPADQKAMYQSGLRAMRLGADSEEAMRSFMHIANHDFTGQGALNIQDYATKINVGTGANMEKSGQVLSAFLHQAKMPATIANVSRAANLQHQATASGDLDMENYNKYGAPAVGKAFSLGNSPVDSLAFLTAMTKQNMRIPQAATNLGGLTWQITHPTAKAQKAIDKAGVSEYFGPEALHTKGGAYNILQAVNSAVGGNKAKLMDIFGNKQGGFGALLATGPGKADYERQLFDPKNGNRAAWEGKIKPVEERYEQAQKTPQMQVKRLQGEMKADSIEVGKSFVPLLTAAVPVLKMFADQVQRVVGFLGKLPQPVQEAIIGLGVMKLATVALGNPLVGLGEGIGALIVKLGGLGEKAGVLSSLGAMLGPIAAPLLAITAAVVAFGIAWETNFGGIRQAFAPFLADVKQTFGGSTKEIQSFVSTTLPDLKKFIAEVEPLFAVHFKILGFVVKVAFDVIKAVVKGALAVVLGVFRTVLALLTGDWKGAWAGIGSIFQGQMDAILGFAKDVSPKFVAWISQLGQDIKAGWIIALNSLKSAFSGGARELVDAFGAGLKNGIASVGPGIKAAAEGIAGLIPTSVKSVLQIHSPSRVMHEIGRNTALGLASGITAGTSQVTAAMRSVVAAALKETDRKKAALLIDHEARGLRSGGMSASDVADFRESAHAQLSSTGRSRRGGKAATAEAQRAERMREQQVKANGRAEALAAKAGALFAQTRQTMTAKLAELADTPKELTADKKRDAAWKEFRRNEQNLGLGKFGPYSQNQMAGKADATALLRKTLAQIGVDETTKKAAATGSVQEDIDRQNDKAAEDKHPYDFQRDQARKEASAQATSGADPAKVAEDLRLKLAAIDKEQLDDTKQTEDRRQQYLLSTQAITLTQYQDYLKTRLGDYHEYSADWVQISQSINDIDLQLWKQQEDALKQKFEAGLIDLKDYIAQMKALEATLPKTAAPDVKAEADDTIARADGKEKKKTDKEIVGGDDFWTGLAGSAADNGSHVLTALLHPKDKKQIFKSMWSDLMGSLEGGVTGQFSKILKNMITGQGGGVSLGSLFGNLFGGSKSSAGTSGVGTAAGVGMSAMMSMIPGLGGMSGLGSLLGPGVAGSLSPQGINGPLGGLQGLTGMLAGAPGQGGPLGGLTSLLPMLGGKGGMLGGLLGHGGLASMAHLLPWLGGGILLNKVLGNPLGKLFKHFHFAKGTLSVPGTGNHDSVPAMLTPGEMVIPKAGAQLVRDALSGHTNAGGGAAPSRQAGPTNIHVTHNGDINNQADGERFHEDTAWHVQQRLATAI